MTKRIRVLLADHLKLVRAGLHALLSNFADVEVVGEAETADNAVSLAASFRCHPDGPGNARQRPSRNTFDQAGVLNIEIIVMTDRVSEGKASSSD